MLLSHSEGVVLSKRAAAWSKGLSLPGSAEQQSYGLLQSLEGSLGLTVRGPHGWLSDLCPADGDDEMEVGAMPGALLQELQRISGRDVIEIEHEDLDRRDRLVFKADGYRRAALMDHLSGFTPQPSVSLPEVDLENASGEVQLSVSLLTELLQLALLAAPSSEVNQARAVITLAFTEEMVTASSTDGFLLMSARGELDDPVQAEAEIHLPTESAARLQGLLSSVSKEDTATLTLAPSGEETYLMVSFADDSAQALMPLPEVAGMPVKRLLDGTKHRKSIAVMNVTSQAVGDLQACGLGRSVVLEVDDSELKAWARADIDAAEADAYVNVVLKTEEIQEGACAVDSVILGNLFKALRGSKVDLQIAEGKGSPGLLVVEQTEDDLAVSVMAGVILQNLRD